MTDQDAVEILLVEDNPQDSELTVRALRKQNLANNILVLEDGARAVDFLLGRGEYAGRPLPARPKVILLDVKLPKVGGLEVLREIRANEATATVPVVMVTSSREDPDIAMAYALGANSYVVKPVEFEAFQSAMVSVGLYWLLINQR